MIIKATPQQVQSPSMTSLIQKYLVFSGDHSYKNGYIEYPFSPEGEKLFSNADLQTCLAEGVVIENGTFFVVQDKTILDQEVPVSFPDSTSIEDGAQRLWRYYDPFYWDLADGTVLITCAHVKEGESSANGLSYEELKLWASEFNSILTRGEGVALIPQPIEEG